MIINPILILFYSFKKLIAKVKKKRDYHKNKENNVNEEIKRRKVNYVVNQNKNKNLKKEKVKKQKELSILTD